MLRKILHLVLVIPAALSAQITVTSADMPDANDSVKVSVSGNDGGSDLSLTGPGYTWDYSALVPDAQRFEKFDAPSSFTTPFNLLFNPFNTSYGRDNYQFNSTALPGMTISDAYDFFKETSTYYRQVGVGFRFNGAPIPMNYSDPDYIHNFPLNYLDLDSCDYKYGAGVPSYGYYGQSGHRVNFADGWGTLITPYDTFTVLRVRSVVAAVDTVYYDDFGFGTTINRPLRYEYRFIANGMKIPVLQIIASDFGGSSPAVTDVQYIDSMRTGVPQVGIMEKGGKDLVFDLYPNPSDELLNIAFSPDADPEISVLDLTGRTVLIQRDKTVGTATINVSGLKAGIYFVKLRSGDHMSVKKFVVAH